MILDKAVREYFQRTLDMCVPKKAKAAMEGRSE